MNNSNKVLLFILLSYVNIFEHEMLNFYKYLKNVISNTFLITSCFCEPTTNELMYTFMKTHHTQSLKIIKQKFISLVPEYVKVLSPRTLP